MSIYKITNITNTIGKREMKYNSTLDINYIDNLAKKKIIIKPGDTIYLNVSELPISVHRLRILELITVVETSLNEMLEVFEKKMKTDMPIQQLPKELIEDETKKAWKEKVNKKR